MKEITLPEFDRNTKIDDQGAYVFNGDCQYDVIFDRDFLSKINIDIPFTNKTMQWMNVTVETRDNRTISVQDKNDKVDF